MKRERRRKKYTEKEIKRKLHEFKKAGKKVVRFVYWQNTTIVDMAKVHLCETESEFGCFRSRGRLRSWLKQVISENASFLLEIVPIEEEE